eukprot:scaffold81319_cov15-Tisochrysis_lutea.AAC.1
MPLNPEAGEVFVETGWERLAKGVGEGAGVGRGGGVHDAGEGRACAEDDVERVGADLRSLW